MSALTEILFKARQALGVNFDIPEGTRPRVSSVNKFGRNPDIDTGSDPEDIWDGGGLWIAPTQARTHDIASSSANDTSAGTGMRTLRIEGLDSNWEEQTEDITLNGTSNVVTSNTYTRIFRMYGLTWGSGQQNAGDITATAQTDGTVTAQISTGNNQSLMAIYTVPANRTAYMVLWYGSINRQGGTGGAMADIQILTRSADQSNAGWRVKHFSGLAVDGTSNYLHKYEPPKKLTEKTDILVRCLEVTDNNTDVSAGFDLVIVNEE